MSGDEYPGGTGAKNSSKRGKVRNADRLQAFASGGPQGDASWGDCDPVKVHAVVIAITGLGGAVTFGLSRDMGAHSITLMLDGNRKTLWFNGDAELSDNLAEVLDTLSAME